MWAEHEQIRSRRHSLAIAEAHAISMQEKAAGAGFARGCSPPCGMRLDPDGSDGGPAQGETEPMWNADWTKVTGEYRLAMRS